MQEQINKNPEVVGKMFDDISSSYDFLNHFLSLNIDKLWRKKMVQMIKLESPAKIIDIATGTSDMAISVLKAIPHSHITGIDISEGMIKIGNQKALKYLFSNQINLIKASAEEIPFDQNHFDAAMVSFGVRNFFNLEKGLLEINRIVKPGKKIFILEFSKPKGFFSFIYFGYLKIILPLIGRHMSKHKNAYQYFRNTILEFPDSEDFLKLLYDAGFVNCKQKRLSGGIATIYSATKVLN